MNQQLRDDFAAARAKYVEMARGCDEMLARLDLVADDPEAAQIRADVLTLAAQLESVSYWIGCAERRFHSLH
jgi:hypothetical protein